MPCSTGSSGDGSAVVRQLDAVLAGVGFTGSGALLDHVGGLEPGAAMDLAVQVVGGVRELVGDHVAHNAYFRNFPDGVPDTIEFWVQCLRNALMAPRADRSGTRPPSDDDLLATLVTGRIGLLNLPTYGRYQHTYAELLAAHDELVASAKDRITVVHLGDTIADEQERLYLELAGSTTPLGEADLALLTELAADCRAGAQPERIPVRENRAVVNGVRLDAGLPLVAVDTVTDVLRLACQVSGGDVTLVEPTRFRSFPRPQRRTLLGALDTVVAANRGKLGDVGRYARPWKRLGERLHPHEYPQFPHAADVFAVARGEQRVRSFAARAELAFADGRPAAAASILSAAPGMLLRSLDHLLRVTAPAEVGAVLDTVASVVGDVSGRVLCSVLEHLQNRSAPDAARVFVGRTRRAWVAPDARPPLDVDAVARATEIVEAELLARLPAHERIVVDPAVLEVALPLSGRASEDGLAVLPRGSRSRVDGDRLRFFTYWRQRAITTDFDLSALLLDADLTMLGHVSYTNLESDGAVHSGDIVEAPDGATEFIDVPLRKVRATYFVPQVNVYSGEGFEEVAESMFGWMVRDREQRGAPFEARTVRTRSELRGTGGVALPMAFGRDPDGGWTATWMHLYLTGSPRFNQIEANRLSTSLLVRGILTRRYLTVGRMVDLLGRKAGAVTPWEPGAVLDAPVVYIGLERPDHLPEGSTVITVERLRELVPE